MRASSIRSDFSRTLSSPTSAPLAVGSRMTRTCPFLTCSPSRTLMSRTMPPSRCCTVLIWVDGITSPVAMETMSMGLTAAQTPNPMTAAEHSPNVR